MSVKFIVILFFSFLGCLHAKAQAGMEKTFGNPLSTQLRVESNATGVVISSLDRVQLAQYDECGNRLYAAQYQRQINPAAGFFAKDFLQLSNGDFVFLVQARSANISKSVLIRTTVSGAVVWSNEIYNPSGDFNFNELSIMEDNQGDIIVFGCLPQTLFGTSFPRLTKIEAGSGQIIWTRSYLISKTFGKAISTSDNGVLMRLGSTLMKVDGNGNLQWAVDAVGLANNSELIFEISDGYIFTNGNSFTNFIEIFKVDFQGNSIAKKSIRIEALAFDIERSGNNSFIVGLSRTNASFNSPVELLEFDDNLNFLRNTRTTISFLGTDLEFNSKLEAIVVGKPTGVNGCITHFNSDFSNNCNTSAVNPTFLDLNFSTNNLSISQSNLNLSIRPFLVSTSPINYTETEVCPASPPEISLGPDRSFCANSTEISDALGGHFDSFLWSTGETSSAIRPSQSGTYWLLATSSCSGLSASDTVEISVFPTVEINLGTTATICGNQTTELIGPDCNNCNYLWSNGSQNQSTNIFEVGTYWLEIESENGCFSSDTIEVDFGLCDCKTYIPSAFTPNGDGINEQFSLSVACQTKSFQFVLIDRWGKVIFQTNNPDFTWDGTLNGQNCTAGFYSYRLEYSPVGADGRLTTQVKSGQIQLLR